MSLFVLRSKQFAVVENPGFWNWTFTLKDIDGEVLAEIDRDWRGFGFEVRSSHLTTNVVSLLINVSFALLIIKAKKYNLDIYRGAFDKNNKVHWLYGERQICSYSLTFFAS